MCECARPIHTDTAVEATLKLLAPLLMLDLVTPGGGPCVSRVTGAAPSCIPHPDGSVRAVFPLSRYLPFGVWKAMLWSGLCRVGEEQLLGGHWGAADVPMVFQCLLQTGPSGLSPGAEAPGAGGGHPKGTGLCPCLAMAPLGLSFPTCKGLCADDLEHPSGWSSSPCTAPMGCLSSDGGGPMVLVESQ